MPSDDEIVGIICKAFVNSRDFNGIAASALTRATDLSWPQLRPKVEALVLARKVDAAFASHCVNPHIKRLPDMSVEGQVKGLELEEPNGICLYPTAEVVAADGHLYRYDCLPYTRRLAVAEAQLTPIFFELSALERYFLDPVTPVASLIGRVTFQCMTSTTCPARWRSAIRFCFNRSGSATTKSEIE
jgi:hypothetical protein